MVGGETQDHELGDGGRESPTGEVTAALGELRDGQEGASERLISAGHSHLRRIARGYRRRERGRREFDTTDLFHEAWLRLFGGEAPRLEDRQHLYGAFARAVRQVLLKDARERHAAKRGGGRERVTLTGLPELGAETSIDILALNQALERREALSERRARNVELRFFAGLSIPEIAETLGIGTTTVDRESAHPRAWLQAQLAS